MRAAEGYDDGPSIHVMSAPYITDEEIARRRGRIMVQLRLEGWSPVSIAKMFRCTDRWAREEIRDVPAAEKRDVLEAMRDVEDPALALAV